MKLIAVMCRKKLPSDMVIDSAEREMSWELWLSEMNHIGLFLSLLNHTSGLLSPEL